MTASSLTTARPPRAAIAWATRDAIFCEIPCKDGPPLIVRYRLTPEGLQQALNILLETPERAPRVSAPDHPAIRRPKPIFDDGEREQVRNILKKLEIV